MPSHNVTEQTEAEGLLKTNGNGATSSTPGYYVGGIRI
jgi:hypothetical protein